MDKLHVILICLLIVSITFLGISAISTDPVLEVSTDHDSDEQEVWSIDITPDHINNIADPDWLGRLKVNSTMNISGNPLLCLNICGNRCIWLGYTYKNHSVKPGTYLWGDKENPICSCECYVIKNRN